MSKEPAVEMRDRCVQVLQRRIRDWLDANQHLPERDQIGYPPFTLMEAVNELEKLEP